MRVCVRVTVCHSACATVRVTCARAAALGTTIVLPEPPPLSPASDPLAVPSPPLEPSTVEAETRPPEDVIQVSASPLPASSEPSARLNFDAARAIPFEPIAIAAGGTTSGSPPGRHDFTRIRHGVGVAVTTELAIYRAACSGEVETALEDHDRQRRVRNSSTTLAPIVGACIYADL